MTTVATKDFELISGEQFKYVKSIIKDEADFNAGLLEACKNGYIEIAKLLIEKGATNLNEALYTAALNSHTSIAKLLIEKGATHFEC